MKSQLNKYRQYTITDYLINTNKFKEYLKFCLEHNLKNEKKNIMDNLLRILQLKENCEKPKLLSELRKLCIYIIIYSDFEIELLFELNYLAFNPEIQKNIFHEMQEYLNIENNEEINKEQKIYINNKYYFWLLKLANKNFSYINEIKETILVEKEVKESVESLKNYIEGINNDVFETKKLNEQSFIIKILYELSLYSYFKGEEKNANIYLNSLVIYYDKYIQKYNADINNDEKNIFYFDIQNIKALIKYYENTKNQQEKMMIIERNEKLINNINIFNEDTIKNCENIVNEDFSKFKNEINNTKNDYLNNLQSSNLDSLNEIDYNDKNCTNVFLSCLKIAEFLSYKSSEEYTYYKIALDYINTLQNKLDYKINSNTNRKDDSDLQYVKKEIFYLLNLLDIINKVNNHQAKLDKSILNNLADYIVNNTLTGNLRLSGMIHSYIINFNQNIRRNSSYFSKFVDFFADKAMVYKQETIKQIVFLDKIIKIFHEINETKSKISFPFDKEISLNLNENIHFELINIFLYWLSLNEESSDSSNLKKQKQKKQLKYPPSINILFILIESLRNLEYLKILKIIYSIVLKFIINFKYLDKLEFNSDLSEAIYETKPKILKVNILFDDIISGFRFVVDDINYYINIKLNIKEKKNLNEYQIKKENINFYIKTLFNLIQIIELKIKNIEQLPQYQANINNNISELINYNKYQFLFSFFSCKEKNLVKSNNNPEIKAAIINGINYFRLIMNDYKTTYMKLDLMNDNIKIKKYYETFKSLIDQDVLYQLILCFYKLKNFLECVILIQYSKKFDKITAFKLLKNMCEKNESINYDNLKYIWKMTLFEYLANFYSNINNIEAINNINRLIKRISNHQFFKGHSIRKNFKIMNFFHFIDYLNNKKYNI